MSYKWRPSASQRAAYAASAREGGQHTYIKTPYPIRTSDEVTYYDVAAGAVRDGVIEAHSYGADRGQHTFSVRLSDGSLRLIKGRNLYPRLLKHVHKGVTA
jgi:hypothetical protein